MVPKKCHLSLVSASVNFELEIARELDASRRVTSWVKADMVGFSIQYDDPVTGSPRQYRPDFIVHLDDGVQLVLEGKGEKRDAEVKLRALDKWVKAVNASNYPYGIWDHDIVRETRCYGIMETRSHEDTVQEARQPHRKDMLRVC